jgi:glycosyltransferase involved in cell wall biosynthesis
MNVDEEKNLIRKYSTYVEDAGIVANPLVSVLMWSYNDLAYIRQSVDSVLMQETNFAYELVVSDDCSTDGTTEILHAYQRSHPDKVRLVLSTENLWTRNVITQRLLYQGRGKYIALTHGDDYWTDSQKLQKQVDYLRAHADCTVCFHDVYDLWPDGSKSPRFSADVNLAAERQQVLCFQQRDLLRKMFVATGSVMFRLAELPHPLPHGIINAPYGDWPLFLSLSRHGNLHCLNEVMGVYRRHEQGAWGSQTPSVVVSNIFSFLNMIRNDSEILNNSTMDDIDHAICLWSSRYYFVARNLPDEEKTVFLQTIISLFSSQPQLWLSFHQMVMERLVEHEREYLAKESLKRTVIVSSTSYQIGNAFMAPIRWIRSLRR